jgi:flagellar hook protein FlgE
VLDESGNAVPLNVDSKRVSSPVATTKIEFSDNIASSDTTATVSNINVYDSRGGKHVWTLQLTKSTAPGATDEWDATVTDDTGAAVGTGSINFIGSVVDPASSTITISTAPQGADPLSVVLDFSSGVTSFSGTTTLRAASVDGYGEGDLTGVTVDEDGAIKLSYSNDQTASGGSVAIADFRDPQDLQQQSNGIFVNKGDGEIRYTKSGASGIGTLVSKQLESSNVDLSKEFGDLILVQRGFQACSQVVSVSNDMIQQLFGIRGQG